MKFKILFFLMICSVGFSDEDQVFLEKVLKEPVRASGATILDEGSYSFSPSEFTMLLLLSKSHASIHTYPEHQSCFVDLFRIYLEPQKVNSHVLKREDQSSDFSKSH